MQRLFQAIPNVAKPQVGAGFDVPSDAQLKHGVGHPGQPLGAVLHAPQDFFLAIAQGAQRLAQQEPAVAVQSRQRRTKIVNRPGEKSRTILVVFLKPEVRLDEAL